MKSITVLAEPAGSCPRTTSAGWGQVGGVVGGECLAVLTQSRLRSHRNVHLDTQMAICKNSNITVWARNFKRHFLNILISDGGLRLDSVGLSLISVV